MRWKIELDYKQLKGHLGLDHYEGRSWRGFHHHAALCALAHGFLSLRRALFPPEDDTLDTRNVRSALQIVLLKMIGYCPLCRQVYEPNTSPRGPSRV